MQSFKCLVIQNLETKRFVVLFVIILLNPLIITKYFKITWDSSKCYLFFTLFICKFNVKVVKDCE